MTIQRRLFIPAVIQLVVLVPVIAVIVTSRAVSRNSLAQSQQANQHMDQLRDLRAAIERYNTSPLHQADLHTEIVTACRGFKQDGDGTDDTSIETIQQRHNRMATAKQRNAVIEQEVIRLVDHAVQQSNDFTAQVATRLADPDQEASVGTLERKVLIGANINTTSNLTVKSLFYRMMADSNAATDLLAYLDQCAKNCQQDVQRLANTAFAGLPIESLKAIEANRELIVEYVANTEGMVQGKTQIDETFRAMLTKVQDANAALHTSVVSSVEQSYLTITFMLVGVVAIVVAITLAITTRLTRTLRDMVHRLTTVAAETSAASGQVSAASQSLAEGATEQAAGLEETSSSLKEMSSMTKQNADNAQQANTLAAEAKKAASTGAESMNRMNVAIQEIQKSSDETAKIIKVIDEIAFQTNLLALNAAVEAARAGEAGKSFAVVAEEVRNLAMRSAEAAKNTTSMIEESVKNSKNGVDIANEVGKVLEEIVQSVGKTTDLVGEIAAASQEQAQGIDQVNTAVAQMDKVTQQNAANAEESASASEELSVQAESMKEVVAQLVALVGGAGSQKSLAGGLKAGHHRLRSSIEYGLHTAEKRGPKQHIFGKSDETFHRIAVHSQRPEHDSAKAIPLENHEDRNEFNS